MAYNDLYWDPTQGPTNGITIYSSDAHPVAPSSGYLVDHDTGTGLDAFIDIEGGGQSSQGIMPDAGTDAETNFSGRINAIGTIDYDVEPCTITVSGLRTNYTYHFVIFGCRGQPSYGDGDASTRVTRVTISDADSWVNNSTPGAAITGTYSSATIITNGYNIEGLVARFSDIKTGPDGDFSITASSETANGLYLNAFSLEEVIPEPSTVALFGVGTLLLVLRRGKK